MAARKTKGTQDKPWSDSTRERIQTSMLLNRLSDHVVGKAEMSSTQVRAAEILLKKSIPDLANVQLSGDPDNPLVHKIEEIRRSVVKP